MVSLSGRSLHSVSRAVLTSSRATVVSSRAQHVFGFFGKQNLHLDRSSVPRQVGLHMESAISIGIRETPVASLILAITLVLVLTSMLLPRLREVLTQHCKSQGGTLCSDRRRLLSAAGIIPIVGLKPKVASAEEVNARTIASANYNFKSIELIHSAAARSIPLSRALRSGRPVVVDFAAAWCPSCLQLAPLMSKMEELYGKDIDFVTLDMTYPSSAYGMGPAADAQKVSELWAQEFRVPALPHVAFVSADGDVLTAFIGVATQDTLEANLQALRDRKPELPYVMYNAFKKGRSLKFPEV